MKQKSRFETARRWLVFWTLFLGLERTGLRSVQCRKGQYKVV